MSEAEAIVRALAESNPLILGNHYRQPILCRYCGGCAISTAAPFTLRHADLCLWLRARRWVEEYGEHGDGVTIRRRDPSQPHEPFTPAIRVEQPIDVRELMGREPLDDDPHIVARRRAHEVTGLAGGYDADWTWDDNAVRRKVEGKA